MSESQRKVTGNLKAVDDNGNQYSIVEYSVFRHTTTTDITYSEESKVKEYELANGTPLNRISETEFEISSNGTKIRIAP